MSTYQAASGAGAPGMAELEDGAVAASLLQRLNLLPAVLIRGLATWVKDGAVPEPKFFAHQLPFNAHASASKAVGRILQALWPGLQLPGHPTDRQVSREWLHEGGDEGMTWHVN